MRRWTAAMCVIPVLATASVAQPPPGVPNGRPQASDSAGDKSATAPADRPAGVDQQRLADWTAIIEGPNTPAARLTAARELLRLGAPEGHRRLAGILSGSNRAARVAAAQAVAELPVVDESLLNPLIGLLSEEDGETRRAAAAAIAKGGSGAIHRLAALLNAAETPESTKLAAIDALGRMTRREAVELLVSALADPTSPLCLAGLEALERATAQDFQGDPAAAQRWWDDTRGIDANAWQQLQVDRLVRQSGSLGQRVRELETRLAAVLRDNYFRAAETDRSGLLSAYLSDTNDVVRSLGLDLVQAQITEGRPPSAEMVAKIRELFTAAEPRVRSSAIRTAASLRDPADVELFIQKLGVEANGDVRRALIYGLGYIGGPDAVPTLLACLGERDRATVDEAITALGRVAERPGLDAGARETIATALLERVSRGGGGPNRERLIRAMSRIPDRRFAPVFLNALNATEPAAVRAAAVRGAALLSDPRASDPAASTQSAGTNGDPSDSARRQLPDALIRATSDPDGSVRKAAVEALSGLAASDAHLNALWSRLSPSQEAEETVRAAAWRGVLRVLSTRTASEVESWVERLPDGGTLRTQRAIELLQAAENQALAANAARGELGRIRSRLAAQRAQLNLTGEAIGAYQAAVEDLCAAASPDAPRVAAELIRYALLNDRYESAVAPFLKNDGLPLDGEAVWEALQRELEPLMQQSSADRAASALAALAAAPPACFGPAVCEQVDRLLARARQLRDESDSQ